MKALTLRVAELEAENSRLLDRLTSAEARADHRMALRQELEALLGIPPGPATDEQFEAGVAAVRSLKAALVRADDRIAALEAALDEATALSVLDDHDGGRPL
jgi:hypothetical protein